MFFFFFEGGGVGGLVGALPSTSPALPIFLFIPPPPLSNPVKGNKRNREGGSYQDTGAHIIYIYVCVHVRYMVITRRFFVCRRQSFQELGAEIERRNFE